METYKFSRIIISTVHTNYHVKLMTLIGIYVEKLFIFPIKALDISIVDFKITIPNKDRQGENIYVLIAFTIPSLALPFPPGSGRGHVTRLYYRTLLIDYTATNKS